MLSVCLPVYDVSIRSLVTALHAQLTAAGVPFEILASDNHPDSRFREDNLKLNNLKGVRYWVNPRPLGRSGNRNQLARAAQYGYLLFADGDAEVHSEDFINNYLPHLSGNAVVCGGTAYHSQPPADRSLLLRWKYGRMREMTPASQRALAPYQRFSAFNFLIPRETFLNILQDDSLTDYGHEDTLFGYELKYRFVPVKHIDNPLIHAGLDPGTVFLEKTRTGVRNLKLLITKGRIDEDVKLYVYYARTKRLSALFRLFFSVLGAAMENNLCGPDPSVRVFDFYKLCYLHSLK